MKVAYWEAKDNKVIGRLKQKESIVKEIASKLNIDTDNLKITYTYPANVFKNWYTPNTLGIVENDGKNLTIAINTQMLNYFITKYEGAFKSSDTEESMELVAKIYTMMVIVTLTEYYTENNAICKDVLDSVDEGMQMLANMYIAARIRMNIPKVRELTIMVNDPYIFMHYNEITEEDWRELFDSVAYITETSKKAKKFWDAMVEKDSGKVLTKPNKLDNLVAELETMYNMYIKELNYRQGCM